MARRPKTYNIRSADTVEEQRQRRAQRRIEKRYRRIDVEDRRSPHGFVVLLCLLGMALVAFYLFGPKLVFEDDVEVDDFARVGPEDAGAAAEVDVVLDPSPFRDPLVSLEDALFDVPAASDGSWRAVAEEVAVASDQMVDALRRGGEPSQLNAADELRAMTSGARSADFDFEGLSDLRGAWFTWRRETFTAAPWLKGAPALRQDRDPAFGAAYRQAALDLQTLVEDALTEIELVADPEDPTPGADARRGRQEAWRAFAEGWTADVDRLRSALPDRPDPSSPTGLLSAVARLRTSFERAQALGAAPTPDVPGLEALVYDLQATQDAFDDLAAR
ncbi:MAG: hypothetical protein AAGN66_04000 [Acidobacteriota bacterium]